MKGTRLNDHILRAIDEELARLRQARALLANSGSAAAVKSSIPASTARASKAGPRRTLGPKARRAIAQAQRKRWAKAKRQPKPAAPATAARKEAAAS